LNKRLAQAIAIAGPVVRISIAGAPPLLPAGGDGTPPALELLALVADVPIEFGLGTPIGEIRFCRNTWLDLLGG